MVGRRLGVRAGASARVLRARSDQRGERRGEHLGRRLGGVDRPDPLRLGGGELGVGRGDPGEELVVLALEPVDGLAACCDRAPARGRVDRQQQRPVGRQAAGGELVDLPDGSIPSPRPAPW